MRMQSAAAVLAALSVAASGCASTRKPHVQHAVEADEAGVEGCDFLGTVTGTSNSRAKFRQEIAFDEIAHAAGELGATHFIVMDAQTRDNYNWLCAPFCSDTLEVTGRAYRCSEPDPES